MKSETYRKIGRGGAGNYYSKQDVVEAAKRAVEDVEAQSQISSASLPNREVSRSEYVNSGRGGVGNFKKGSDPSSSSVVPPTTTQVLRGTRVPELGYSGRGGAGNSRNGEIEKMLLDAETQAKEAQNRAHEEAVKDVEMELKPPERAHLVSERI